MKSASINENKIATSKASKRLANIGISNTLYTFIWYSKNAGAVEAIQNWVHKLLMRDLKVGPQNTYAISLIGTQKVCANAHPWALGSIAPVK